MVGGASDAGIGILIEWDEEAEGELVFDDLDTLRIALVVEERDSLADEADGSLEVAAFEGDGSILCHFTTDGGAEIIAKIFRRWAHEADLGEIPIEGRLSRGGVDTSVVVAVEPFAEEFVESLEREAFGEDLE